MPDPNPREKYIFLSSPENVSQEREEVREYFKELTQRERATSGLRFTVIGGEDALLGLGRPMDRINDLFAYYKDDLILYIGIMGTRFGSPTGKYGSGTEEEFNEAKEVRGDGSLPEIKFFFQKVSISSEAPDEEHDEFRRVVKFRKSLSNDLFFGTYDKTEDFRNRFRSKLNPWIGQFISRLGSRDPKPEQGSSSTKFQVSEIDKLPIFEMVPVLQCVTDARWQISHFNERVWKTVLGYEASMENLVKEAEYKASPSDQGQGLGILHLIHKADRTPTQNEMTALMDAEKDGEQKNFRNRYIHADGSYRWIEWYSRRFNYDDGEQEKPLIYSIGTDITEDYMSKLLLGHIGEGVSWERLLTNLAHTISGVIPYDVFVVTIFNKGETIRYGQNLFVRSIGGGSDSDQVFERMVLDIDKEAEEFFSDRLQNIPRVVNEESEQEDFLSIMASPSIRENDQVREILKTFPSFIYVPIFRNSFLATVTFLCREKEKLTDKHLARLKRFNTEIIVLDALQRKSVFEPMRELTKWFQSTARRD